MSNTGTHAATECLDLEDLAAFADRRLSGAERQRALEHLADCERCYEVYAEVLSFQEEERLADGGAGRRAEVVTHPRARRWLWPATGALAAAALAVLVVAPLVRDGDFAPPPAGWDADHGWPVFRGEALASEEGAALRLGVLGVDLEVALAADRTEQAAKLSSQLVTLLDSVPGSELQQVLYEQIYERLSGGEPAADLIDDAETAQGLMEDFAEPSARYALGRWAEEARAAALVGDRRFFTGGTTRRFLRELENVELPGEISRELDAVRARIAGGLTAEDLADLEKSLARVIELGGSR